MGIIHNVEKLTDNRFVNLYHLKATSVHNTPVSYYVASRAKSEEQLMLRTGKNTPDGGWSTKSAWKKARLWLICSR